MFVQILCIDLLTLSYPRHEKIQNILFFWLIIFKGHVKVLKMQKKIFWQTWNLEKLKVGLISPDRVESEEKCKIS